VGGWVDGWVGGCKRVGGCQCLYCSDEQKFAAVMALAVGVCVHVRVCLCVCVRSCVHVCACVGMKETEKLCVCCEDEKR